MRQGDALERLAAVRRVAFDKTGTLTWGEPELVCAESALPDLDDGELLALTAAAELRSEHPLGKAVVRSLKAKGGEPLQPEGFTMQPGRGVSARVSGREVLAGNEELLRENGVELDPAARARAEAWREKGCTLILVVVDGRAAGFLALSDTLRPDSAATIAQLTALGAEPVLLTGDHAQAARTIAGQVGIRRVYSDCLPEDKLSAIAQSQKEGKPICMIGDGINDAPALKLADVGIAMGGVGSDIAVDAADIALVNDEIKQLPHLLALSRRMMVVIRFNLIFSMALNFLAIVLAITGALGPVVGALVHNAGSVLVIAHSALLLGFKKRV